MKGWPGASSTVRAMVPSMSRRSRSESAPRSSRPALIAQTTRSEEASKRALTAPLSTSISNRSTRNLRSWAAAERSPAFSVKTKHSELEASKRVVTVACSRRVQEAAQERPAPEEPQRDGEEPGRAPEHARDRGALADAGERPSHQAGERGHAEHRAEPEQGDVDEPRGGAGQAREHDRGQGAAPGQAVDDAHQEGTAGERPAAQVDVPHARLVHVPLAAMGVQEARAGPALHRGPLERARAERKQHDGDAQFEPVRKAGRKRRFQEGEREGDPEQRGGVAEAPEEPQREPAARAPAVSPSDQGGDRREMIGLARVAHPEQHPEQRSGQCLHAGLPMASGYHTETVRRRGQERFHVLLRLELWERCKPSTHFARSLRIRPPRRYSWCNDDLSSSFSPSSSSLPQAAHWPRDRSSWRRAGATR